MADHPFAAALSKDIEYRRTPEYLLQGHRAIVRRAADAGISPKEIANHAKATFPELKALDVGKIEAAVRGILSEGGETKKPATSAKTQSPKTATPPAPAAPPPPPGPTTAT